MYYPQPCMEVGLRSTEGGNSQQVAATTTSAQSTVIGANVAGVPVYVVVTTTAPVFVRSGTSPTAVNTGADHYIPANVPVRLSIIGGQRLAVITPTGTATVYITLDL